MINANNFIHIEGRITADPEVKTYRSQRTGDGFKSCKFTVAVRRDKDTSDFIECSALGRNAEFVGRYFTKGDGIAVVGSLQQYEFNAKDGSKRKGWQIAVESTTFPIAPKKEASEEVAEAPVVVSNDEDLPF